MEIYELQKNVVIVCAEGIVDEKGQELGAEVASTDPAGNKVLSGAAEALRQILIQPARRHLLHQQAPQRIGQGRHLHP